MLDPLTREQVTPRIFGEMSVVVIDPVQFIIGYAGQAAARGQRRRSSRGSRASS